ncbi:MAG: hypothetical protein WBA51_16015 [Erythrobacter sp.]
MQPYTIVSAILAAFAAVMALPVAAKDMPPAQDYQWLEAQNFSDEEAVAGCDQYASHPLDKFKPANVAGVANDADVDALSAYLYCFLALKVDQTNPRILFQWGRANQIRNPRSVGQPRHMYRLAYKGGSEIAGVYLARLPPEKSWAELREEVQRDMARIKGQQRQRPMTGKERDEILIGSIVTIGSVALLKILSGEATWPSGECSGGYMIDANTHEVLCNGLVVGTY